MVTGVHEEVTYCSPGMSSSKQKKFSSASQLHFAVKTPPQQSKQIIFLASQRLANKSTSASFKSDIQRTSMLPKSLATTMPTFDGKSEKFELFEENCQTSFKINNQPIEDNRINYFQSFMRGDALQTFKNINGSTQENLIDIRDFLEVFRMKYVKPQSMAMAKHNFHKFVFDPANQKLINFLHERKELPENAFELAAHAIIELFIYAEMPPNLKKSRNQIRLENGKHEQIVAHFEKE